LSDQLYEDNLQNAVLEVNRGELVGCILLIDNFNELDSDWQAILDQYAGNALETVLMTAKVDASGEPIPPIEYDSHPIKRAALPEQIFIVGEMRPENDD
jgi:hypothetical protein